MFRRSVHQIPIVDISRIAKVERVDFLPLGVMAPFEAAHENEQGHLTVFVDL